jgi:hypothetical protein
MTRPPSEAVDLTHLIPHLQEHLFDVGAAPPFTPAGFAFELHAHFTEDRLRIVDPDN